MPKDAEIFAFIGFSFGGELSFLLADKWNKATGKKPLVILGDTILTGTQDLQPKDVEHITYTQEYFEQYLKTTQESGQKLTEKVCRELAQKQVLSDNIAFVLQSKVHMNSYSGHAVFFNALLDCSRADTEKKLSVLDRYAEDYEVIDFRGVDHWSLFMQRSLEPFYDKLFARLLKEYGKH